MSTGTVKWFNSKKGYGFIQPETGGKDIFVHVTKLEEKGIKKLYDGQKVSYEIYDDRGRTAAGEIQILSQIYFLIFPLKRLCLRTIGRAFYFLR